MTVFSSTHPAAALIVRAWLFLLPELDLWAEAVRRRQIRRSYGRMSDAQLRDIGLTPYELEVALALPLDRSAGSALAKAAHEEAAKW